MRYDIYTSKLYQIVLQYKENFVLSLYKIQHIPDSSSMQRQFCFKPIPDTTYTSNKLPKNIFIIFDHYYEYFEKSQQQSTKTPPQVNKKGKLLFTQFNNCLT